MVLKLLHRVKIMKKTNKLWKTFKVRWDIVETISLCNFLFVTQGEESLGYQELVAAAKRVDSVPIAICTVKEVWADYSLSSDTITLFRKVSYSNII